MNVRVFPLVGGVLALTLGGLLAVTGTALLPPGPVRVLAYAVAVLGVLAMATLDVLTRATVDVSPATLSGADRREGLATPGDDVDETLASLSPDDRRGRLVLRERVEAVAAGVLARRMGISREEARERLADGDWTDDPRAAALFTEASPSLGERVRSLVVGRSTFRRRVDAATAELVRLADGEGRVDQAGGGSDGAGADASGDESPTDGSGADASGDESPTDENPTPGPDRTGDEDPTPGPDRTGDEEPADGPTGEGSPGGAADPGPAEEGDGGG